MSDPVARLDPATSKPVSLCETAGLVLGELARRKQLSSESAVRAFGLIERFAAFVTGAVGIEFLAAVTSAHVDAFARSATVREGRTPSAATMRLRRWAVRLFFRTARELGLSDADPTLDVALPGRLKSRPRPLTDDEVARARRAALVDLSSTRLSAAWALGEATARTAEIPHCRLRDVQLDRARVWIHGSSQTTPRWGTLTGWGCGQLERRIRELGRYADSSTLVAYRGAAGLETRRSVSAQALRETLVRAGLDTRPDVRPGSLAAWAGIQVWHATGRINATARALGVRSLDAAAELIEWDWTDTAGPADA